MKRFIVFKFRPIATPSDETNAPTSVNFPRLRSNPGLRVFQASWPKLDFLDCLKAVAERVGLEQEDFWLHKFRATFATKHLQVGVDLRTLQLWLGHKDLESTMRYLKPARGKGAPEKVNATFA